MSHRVGNIKNQNVYVFAYHSLSNSRDRQKKFTDETHESNAYMVQIWCKCLDFKAMSKQKDELFGLNCCHLCGTPCIEVGGLLRTVSIFHTFNKSIPGRSTRSCLRRFPLRRTLCPKQEQEITNTASALLFLIANLAVMYWLIMYELM